MGANGLAVCSHPFERSIFMDAIALRLSPQQDLKAELDAFALAQNLEAACIVTCVGSLTQAVLRLAGASEGTVYNGRFEIVSLVGTLSKHGSHYHGAIADSTGHITGGHILRGCLIYTTAEIVIGILPNLSFQRTYDAATGYRELAIENKISK
jgi:uncharacterized protein